MERHEPGGARYGMAIDVDRCTGCGDCMVACTVENNVSTPPIEAKEIKALTWMRVYRVDNGRSFPEGRIVYVPIPCQHCDHHTPCISVCPATAVDRDAMTGIVGQMPQRCIGCRYCMAACPYHARYYNWWDPVWPEGMVETMNPDISPRMRGVVEKCNFCIGRLHRAQEKAAHGGSREIEPADYVPACAEVCPTGAITFGDLSDKKSGVARLAASKNAFRLMESVGSEPKVYYLSRHKWVRRVGESRLARMKAGD